MQRMHIATYHSAASGTYQASLVEGGGLSERLTFVICTFYLVGVKRGF